MADAPTLIRGPKMLTDANRKLVWVPSLKDYHNPTAAELNAGLDISCLITANNFSLGSTGDEQISVSAFCASGNSSAPGRTNYEGSMDFFRFVNKTDDVAWTTFAAKGIHGYLVQRIGQKEVGQKAHEVPFKAADEVQVYEAITGTPQIIAPPDNGSYEMFKEMFSIQEQVDERAKVAAAA